MIGILRDTLPLKAIYLAYFTAGVLMSPTLPVVGNKLAIADVFILFLFMITLLGNLRGRRKGSFGSMDKRSWLPLAILFLFHAAISMLLTGIFENYSVSTSFIAVLTYCYGFGVFCCAVSWLDTPERLRRAIAAWVAGAVMVGLIGTAALIGVAPDWAYDGIRVSSTLRSTNQMQSYLAPPLFVLLFLAVGQSSYKRIRFVSFVSALPLAASLIATGSRSSIIMIVLCGCIILYQFVKRMKESAAVAVSGSFVLVGLIFGVIPGIVALFTYGVDILPPGPIRAAARPIRKFQEMFHSNDTIEALGPRGHQAEIVFSHWHENAIFGVGPGNFKQAFNHHHEVHNTYLGLLIEHGVVGLLLFLSFMFIIFSRNIILVFATKAPVPRLILVVTAGAFLFILLYGVFAFGIRQRIFWLGLALSASAIRVYSPTSLIQPNVSKG